MSPRQEMRVGWLRTYWFKKSRHHKRADVEIIGVRIGRRTREMPKTTVAVATRQRPARRLLDGSAAVSAIMSELAKCEDRIKRCVAIPRWQVEQPTAVRFLIPERALDNSFRHRCRFAHQPIVMRRM